MRIRAAGRKDLDMIWAATTETVWNDLPPDERDTFGRSTFEAHFRSHATQVIDSPDNVILVAEGPSGDLVGYIIFGPATSMLSQGPFGFVYDIWVAPRARRQGVARKLLERATEWCRANGHEKVKLEVSARNAAARALYASAGFTEERLTLGKAL